MYAMSAKKNFCFCDVMVSVLDFIAVDLVGSTQFTNKMCICCFFTKHAAFRNKDTMTRSQVNVLSDERIVKDFHRRRILLQRNSLGK
jgi:hypothetical protein